MGSSKHCLGTTTKLYAWILSARLFTPFTVDNVYVCECVCACVWAFLCVFVCVCVCAVRHQWTQWDRQPMGAQEEGAWPDEERGNSSSSRRRAGVCRASLTTTTSYARPTWQEATGDHVTMTLQSQDNRVLSIALLPSNRTTNRLCPH